MTLPVHRAQGKAYLGALSLVQLPSSRGAKTGPEHFTTSAGKDPRERRTQAHTFFVPSLVVCWIVKPERRSE